MTPRKVIGSVGQVRNRHINSSDEQLPKCRACDLLGNRLTRDESANKRFCAMHDRKVNAPLNRPVRRDLIIFDCDGVLVDSELLSCNALIGCLRRHSIPIDFQTVIDRFLGRSTQAVRDYCALHGQVLPDNFFNELSVAVEAAFSRALQPIPGAAAVLQMLSVPFCVASSSDIKRINHSLRLTGLADMVGGRIFSAGMVRNGKPAPDLFVYAAAKMGAAPERTLVIEDSVSGVQAGKAAGMSVWGFVGGTHYRFGGGRALLEAAGADRVFDRMADFDQVAAGLINGPSR